MDWIKAGRSETSSLTLLRRMQAGITYTKGKYFFTAILELGFDVEVAYAIHESPLPRAGEQLCSTSSVFRGILMFWIPRNTRFDDGVHDRQQLVHASDQSDLLGLPVGQQPFIESLDHRVVTAGTERSHV